MAKSQSNFVRVFLIPTGVMLAVLFGGAYGTGREAVQFISSNGPMGGIFAVALYSLLVMVVIALSFVLAQHFKAYDYRNFIKVLLGKAWFLYEIVIVIALLLVLSICGSICANILLDQYGFPSTAGYVLTMTIIVFLSYWGRNVIEQTMVYCSSALILILIVFIALVLVKDGGVVYNVIATSEVQSDWWKSGAQYAWFSVGFVPILLYCARGFESRSEALGGGLFAGLFVAVPAIVFHISYMAQYPHVLSEPLPVYWMMTVYKIPFFLEAYIIVLFSLVIQTGIGSIQGVIERLDAWRREVSGNALSKKAHVLTTLSMVVASWVLSKLGIIDLIATGYGTIAWCFMIFFVIPLLTVGVYRLVTSKEKEVDACTVCTDIDGQEECGAELGENTTL